MATAITEINSQLAALIPSDGSINGTALQQNAASLMYLAQTSVYDDVQALWWGTGLNVGQFTDQYTQNLTGTHHAVALS